MAHQQEIRNRPKLGLSVLNPVASTVHSWLQLASLAATTMGWPAPGGAGPGLLRASPAAPHLALLAKEKLGAFQDTHTTPWNTPRSSHHFPGVPFEPGCASELQFDNRSAFSKKSSSGDSEHGLKLRVSTI